MQCFKKKNFSRCMRSQQLCSTGNGRQDKQSQQIINDLLFYRLICAHCTFIAFLAYMQCIARHSLPPFSQCTERYCRCCCCGKLYTNIYTYSTVSNKDQMMQVALFFRSENKTRQFNGNTIYFQLENKNVERNL